MSQPNFLFIMTDHQTTATVNSDVCHTPNLDRVIEDGVRFRRAYTANAICSPARATLFTGVHVHSHGMYDCTHTVDDARARFRTELPNWSNALADAGYHCGYFGKWHVERSNDLRQFGWSHQLSEGYAKWRETMGFGPVPEPSMQRVLGGKGYRDTPLYGVIDDPADATVTSHIFSRGIECLEQQLAGDEPWCLFLSTPDPHDAYIVPRELYEMYDPYAIEPPVSFGDDLAGKPNVLKRMQKVFDELTWEECAEAIACFYASCTDIDRQVGKVLDALERTGQADNTVIVYLTDHGDLLGAHGLFTKGVTPYEEVYNIPLIVSDPRREAAGVDCDRIASIGDVCPTVLDLAGLEPFDPCHFRSLVPLLDDPTGPGWVDEAYAEFHGQRYFFTQRIFWRDQLKYVLNAFDFDEMYDLAEDPHELHNIADDPRYSATKDEMLKGIWAQIHRTGDDTLANAHYWSLRFFDLGPDCVEHQDSF